MPDCTECLNYDDFHGYCSEHKTFARNVSKDCTVFNFRHKPIQIVEMVIKTLSNYQGHDDEYYSNINIEFLLSTPIDVTVQDDSYSWDRVRMKCISDDDVGLFFSDGEGKDIDGINIPKKLLKLIFQRIVKEERVGGKLRSWVLHEDVEALYCAEDEDLSLEHSLISCGFEVETLHDGNYYVYRTGDQAILSDICDTTNTPYELDSELLVQVKEDDLNKIEVVVEGREDRHIMSLDRGMLDSIIDILDV